MTFFRGTRRCLSSGEIEKILLELEDEFEDSDSEIEYNESSGDPSVCRQ